MGQPGFVYVMTNEAMPGLVKIGRTERDPIKRSRELDSTGVPMEFSLQYAVYCRDCAEMEQRVHERLDDHRLRAQREFFSISAEQAIHYVAQDAIADHGCVLLPIPCAKMFLAMLERIERLTGHSFSYWDVPMLLCKLSDESIGEMVADIEPPENEQDVQDALARAAMEAECPIE